MEPLKRPRLYRAPLAGVAAAFICGIIVGRYVPLTLLFWAACGFASFLVAIVTFRRPYLLSVTSAAILASVAFLGAALTRQAYYTVADDDIVTYTDRRATLATVRGRIITSPKIYNPSASVKFGYTRGPQTCFVVRAMQIRTTGGWQKVGGLARVTIGQIDDRLAAGQKVELLCWLSRPRGPANPGQFDWAAKAKINRVLTRINVPAADGVTILTGADRPWYDRVFWNIRSAARRHLTCCADEETGHLLNALIIGERHAALGEMNRQMTRTGVAHFLSISGLHLGVFLGFVYFLCRLLSLTPRRAAAGVLVVLAAYMLLAETRAPLLRSAVMAAAICLSVIFRRHLRPLNALALAAIILLAFDPLQLFQAGFQLSFTIVTGLILLHNPARNLLFGRFFRRRGLMVFRDEQRAQRWLYYKAADWLTHAITMCLIAYLMAGPLVAYHFGILSPYAPLLTLLLFPLVVAVLVPGYLSVALAWPMPNLSYLIGRPAALAADGLARTVDAISRLPAACLEMREVPAVWAILCYATIAAIWMHRRIRFGRAWAAAGILAVAALTAYTQRPASPPDAPELHILAVGNGQCAVLHTPGGQTFLFDAGSRSGFDSYKATMAPFLRNSRLPPPEAAFISHANTDHYNALPGLLAGGGLKRVYLNDYFGRGGEAEHPDAKKFLALIRSSGVELVRIRAGDTIYLDEQTKVEVLWPPAKMRDDLAGNINETSLVLRVVSGGRSVLITGDIGATAQDELCRNASGVRADVLIAPHHAAWIEKKTTSGGNILPAFLEAVAPKIVLVSRSGEPFVPECASPDRRKFYSRLKTAYRYYSTPRNGWICVRFGRKGIRVKTMR